MGEKTKNAIIDILKSDEIKEYFEELLQGQTKEIAYIVAEREDEKQSDELRMAKERYDEEYQKRQEAENVVTRINREKEELQGKYEHLLKDCNDLKGKLLSANDANGQLKQQIDDLGKKYAEAELEVQKQRQNYQNDIGTIQDALRRYESRYSGIDKAFSAYLSLSDEIKHRLKNIFRAENLFAFMASASEWDNVEGVWGFAKRRIIEDEGDDTIKLVFLFRFLFDSYSQFSDRGSYELISPVAGEKFDSDRHSIKGIKTDGYISELLLDGIYDINSGKVIYKAVVEVR